MMTEKQNTTQAFAVQIILVNFNSLVETNGSENS